MVRTVLIVDDFAEFRSAARDVLEAAGFRVVGEAGDGASAIAEVQRLRPDVVLLDINLPDSDGFAVEQRLAAEWEPTRRPLVVFVSSRRASDYRRRLAASTALGFLPKGELTGASLTALLERS